MRNRGEPTAHPRAVREGQESGRVVTEGLRVSCCAGGEGCCNKPSYAEPRWTIRTTLAERRLGGGEAAHLRDADDEPPDGVCGCQLEGEVGSRLPGVVRE